MTTRPGTLAAIPGRPRSVFVASAAMAILVLVLPLAAGTAPSSYGEGSGVEWTNGTVLCQFSMGFPSVDVSADSDGGNGLIISALNISELGPDGSVAAVAMLDSANWSVSNLSNDDAYALDYWASVNLTSPGTPASTVGTAGISLDFVLPAYEGTEYGPTDAVNMVLTISNWSWQAAGDHLALSFGAAPSSPATQQLSPSTATGWVLESSSGSSNEAWERVGTNSTAEVTTGTGVPEAVTADTTLAISSASAANVSVQFADAGEVDSLSFVTRIGVVGPATVAGVPLPYLVGAGVAGILVSAAVAFGADRVRRRPSTLIYVSPGEPR